MSKPADTSALAVAALQEQARTPAQRSYDDAVKTLRPTLVRLFGNEQRAERFVTIGQLEARRNPKLYEVDQSALLGALVVCSQVDLEPGPLGLVYLVPFKREVVPIIGYRGYVELAFRSGLVKDVSASLVYEGDGFEYREGTRPFLDHSPAPPENDKEREVIAAYAVARLKSGGNPFRVIYEADWEKARKASQLGKDNRGPWKDDRDAMILKTAYRRLEPKLPKLGAAPWLEVAAARDELPAPLIEEADAISQPEESA